MKHWTRIAVVAALLAVVVVACGPSGPSEAELAQQEEWEALQEARAALDAKRAELAEMRAQAAAAVETAEEEVEEAAAAAPSGEEIEKLAAEIAGETEEFTGRLVAFLNADPMIEGEPPSERQLAALRMKSAEDILLAQEWIDKGGDYKRAIDIYNTALRFDPDNPDVKAALAEAEANRFMTQERFAAVKKGMSEAEVRALLGQVNLHNRKEFPDREVIAWFYPTGDDGGAAAVWFDKKNDEWKVYRVKFDEVKPRSEGEQES